VNGRELVVDFVARGASSNEWKLVIVEEGPWIGLVEDHLRRVQERLYDCMDAALEGRVAERFPESRGARTVVQLDCYNVPRAEVEEFFERFSSGVMAVSDNRQALEKSEFVADIAFKVFFGDHAG